MMSQAYSSVAILLVAIGCRAGSVDVHQDDDVAMDDELGDDGGSDTDAEDPDGDEGSGDSGDGDDGDDADADQVIYEGGIEIVFANNQELFCEGPVWFETAGDVLTGEGDCELLAGPGAGEIVELVFRGEARGRSFEGSVVSDWVTPEGAGMAAATFEAHIKDRFLSMVWGSEVPVPESSEFVEVEGSARAQY